MRPLSTRISLAILVLSTACSFAPHLHAQTTDDVLPPAEWQRIDSSVERGLQWLASQQQRNGSFPTLPQGQPGVTSLCVMAFVAHGHLPGEGPYGAQLQRALDFIVSCQKPNGLIAFVGPAGKKLSRNVSREIGSTAAYNHALSALVLSEVFAMGGGDLEENQKVIEKALQATLEMQRWPKPNEEDKGGWRYVNHHKEIESDLSVTGWQLMFLRSAKNAGFEVPQEPVEQAVGYVQRCFRKDLGAFAYNLDPEDLPSRGMAGAGILALAHAGLHKTSEAEIVGDWLLKNRFDVYNDGHMQEFDRYHYGLLTCCQAMYQIGGRHWEQFFPSTVKTLLTNQNREGSWNPENHQSDRKFGISYTTSICLIALGAPNQLLPIFQR